MRILGIGESVIDSVHIVRRGRISSQLAHERSSQHIGGPVLSALILLSRLRVNCTLLTSLGSDNEAEMIKQKLKDEHVRLILNHESKTKVHTIIVHPQDGHRTKMRGTTKHHPIQGIPGEFIQEFDLIICDRHEQNAFYEVIRKKKASAKVLIDPSTEVSAFTSDMIRNADYPILPIESLVGFGKSMGLMDNLRAVYTICNRPFVVTLGKLGSILYNGHQADIIPAARITPVDVTGAGDIYRGAFAYGVIQGLELYDCAKFANAVAALQCTKMGNVAAIPSKEDVGNLPEMHIGNRQSSIVEINNHINNLFKYI